MDGVEVEQQQQPVDDNDNGGSSFMEVVEPVVDSNGNTTPTSTATEIFDNSNKSALQDNIERKGQNAYYFAHAHKATGPKWDGKPEPRLLSRLESSDDGTSSSSMVVTGHRKPHSFDYAKSNITSYAFLDGDKSVKLYIELEGVGEKCTEDDICLDFTESSFSLVIQNYPTAGSNNNNPAAPSGTPLCLSFGKLTANITNASYKKKKDRIIVTLTKAAEGKWETVNDKGNPDHDLV